MRGGKDFRGACRRAVAWLLADLERLAAGRGRVDLGHLSIIHLLTERAQEAGHGCGGVGLRVLVIEGVADLPQFCLVELHTRTLVIGQVAQLVDEGQAAGQTCAHAAAVALVSP